jgi:hypothetical protein
VFLLPRSHLISEIEADWRELDVWLRIGGLGGAAVEFHADKFGQQALRLNLGQLGLVVRRLRGDRKGGVEGG